MRPKHKKAGPLLRGPAGFMSAYFFEKGFERLFMAMLP